MSKSQKRIWSTEELTIAFYISKYGMNGLNTNKQELVDYVIGNTTQRSLDMQVANFNFLLGVGEYQLEDASKAQKDVVDALGNKTITQVRKLIFSYMDEIDSTITQRQTSVKNKSVTEKRDEANALLNSTFENKIAAMRKAGRRLTPVKK